MINDSERDHRWRTRAGASFGLAPTDRSRTSWHLPHRRLSGAKRRRYHRVIEFAVVFGFAVWLVIFTLRSNGLSLRIDHPLWLLAAVAFEVASMASFARVQRITLSAGGVKIPLLEALRITYASNAVSVTVPVAGSTAATANTASEYSHQGADPALITWTLLITGIVSTLAFAFLIALGAVLSGNALAALAGIGITVAGTLPMLALLVGVRHRRGRDRIVAVIVHPLRLSSRTVRWPAQPQQWAEDVVGQLGSHHLGWTASVKVLFFAASNWLLDAACLCATVAAFGQPVPWRFMFAIYATGIGAAAVGFTPAGIGIVEAAIASALTAGGIVEFRALPTALAYRAISCWFVLAVGWVLFTRARRHLRTPHHHANDE